MYFPLIWLLIFVIRLLARQAGAKSSISGPAVGIANLLLAVLGFSIALPLATAAATWVSGFESLGFALLLLVPASFAAAFYATFTFPHWLAWRVLGPWGWPRLGRRLLQLGVFRSEAARGGALEMYRLHFSGRGDPRQVPVTLWTVAAAALLAERRGEQEMADALFALFAEPRFRVRSWRRPASVVGERLAWNALRAGDRERARDAASTGWGRGLWLPRLLVRRSFGGTVPAFRLWLAWLAGPDRRASYPWLRSALAEPEGRAIVPAAKFDAESLLAAPHRGHLVLLAHAASGRAISSGELEEIAAGWTLRLAAPPARAGLLGRAADLGAAEPISLPEELRTSLLADLELLAERVEGEWSPAEGTLAATLRRKAIGHAHERVNREVVEFETAENDNAPTRLMASAIEELERWVRLRSAVEQLIRRGGTTELRSAWYSGLRSTACNWGVFLVRQRGDEATWPAYLMHAWSGDLADEVGDAEIETLSRNNAKLTRRRLG